MLTVVYLKADIPVQRTCFIAPDVAQHMKIWKNTLFFLNTQDLCKSNIRAFSCRSIRLGLEHPCVGLTILVLLESVSFNEGCNQQPSAETLLKYAIYR